MDIRLILDFEVSRLERELDGEVTAVARPLLLQAGQSRSITISDNERYVIESLEEGVIVSSGTGEFNPYSEILEELQEVHRGVIRIENLSERPRIARFVSLYLKK